LYIHEQIPLENVLALLVFLRRFVGLVVFPPKRRPALDAIDVSDGVIASRHGTVIWLSFDDIDNSVEKVGPPVLPIECLSDAALSAIMMLRCAPPMKRALTTYSRHHRVNGCQVGLACRAPIYAFAREVSPVTHAHCGLVQAAYW
jgi:hypothetical protein